MGPLGPPGAPEGWWGHYGASRYFYGVVVISTGWSLLLRGKSLFLRGGRYCYGVIFIGSGCGRGARGRGLGPGPGAGAGARDRGRGLGPGPGPRAGAQDPGPRGRD